MADRNSTQYTATTVGPMRVTQAGSRQSRVEKTMDKCKEAKNTRSQWEPVFQECYDYAMPNRTGFYEEDLQGGKNTDDILDSTAVHAVTDFTSRIKSGVIPDGSNWIDMTAGTDYEGTPDEQDLNAALEEIQADVFESLQDSNFSSESDESIQEMSIGTGFIYAEDGGVEAPFKFTAVPLSQVWINRGPFGQIDEIFRQIKCRAEDVPVKWPDGTLSQQLAKCIKEEPRKELTFVEATCRDHKDKNIVHMHEVIWPDDKHMVWDKKMTGEGSNPWIPFRWATGAGEVWGRGPLMATLPDIRTCNLTIELILENAERAIAGMWQSDDEAINPDTVTFVPGTIVPKLPGTEGLTPLEAPGRLDFAQMILGDMRENIKRGLFSDPLYREEKTPPTATEAAGQLADLNRRISSPFGRMVNELQKPVAKRLIYLRREAGKIEIPQINGRMIKMKPTSPLAKVADQETILAIDRFLEQVSVRFGPQMVNFVIDTQETTQMLAELHGVPAKLVRNDQQITEIASRIAELTASRVDEVGPGGNVEDILRQAA